MKFKLLSIIFALTLVFLLPLISADVTQDNYFKEGTIKPNGDIVPINGSTNFTSINNVNVLGFNCSSGDTNLANPSEHCTSVSGRLWPNVLTSNNDFFLQLIYPTNLLSTYGYGIYIYKEGYIPWEVWATWNGTGQAPSSTRYLTKKESCTSKVNSMDASYTNHIINIETEVRSPVSNAGPLDYLPPELVSIYSANAQVNLEIKKDNVIFYTETKPLTIPFSESKSVSFSVPATEPGEYIIKIYTTVNNEQKCISYTQDYKQEILTIPEYVCNFDCEIDGYIGDRFCKQDGNVYQNYKTFTCNAPGTSQSTCTSLIEESKIQDCDFGCNNGICNTPECTIDADCPSGKFCVNNIYVPPACSQNSDCGQNECTGNPNYCIANIANQVFQDFIYYTCHNLGQENSYCTNQTPPFSMETCPNNYYSNAFCENNNLYKNLHNFGCRTGSCFEEIIKELFQTCQHGCNATTNTCNQPECTTNADCPNGKICINNVCIQPADNNPPIITLVSPENNSTKNKGQVDFTFHADDESNIFVCSLILKFNNNETIAETSTSINKLIDNILIHFFQIIGEYQWKITCTDEFNNTGESEKRTLTITEPSQPICQTDTDCGQSSSKLICRNNDLTTEITTPKCVFDLLSLSYKCENTITYELEESCRHGCKIRNNVTQCTPSSSHSSSDECYDEEGNIIDCDLINQQTQTRRTQATYTLSITSSTTETNQSTTQYPNKLIQTTKSRLNLNYILYIVTGIIILLLLIVLILLLARKSRRPVRKQPINPVKK